MVAREYGTIMLIREMDISYLSTHAQQIEEEKLKERSREAKRQRPVMVTFHIRGPMDMVILDSDKGSPV